jgi:hypothetical protein
MSTDTYTLDVDADEAALVMEYRARKSAPPAPKAEPKRKPKTSASTVLLGVLFVALVISIVGWIGLNAAVAFGLVTPPGLAQPTAEPLPTAAVSVRSAPVTRQEPFSAPIAVQPASVYPDTVAPFLRGAWTPAGPFELDVSGRQYRVIGQQDGATFAELDDGTRLWLGTAAVAGPGSVSGGNWDAAPVAVPDEVAVNAGQAAGENAGAVDEHGHVLPYDPADPTAVATWHQALKNSGVDVDATQVACNADLAAGGNGCQP